MNNQSNNAAGNGTIENLDDLNAFLQKSIQLVSKWKEEDDARRAQIEQMLDVFSNGLETIQKMSSDNSLVERSSPIDLLNADSGMQNNIPLVEVEPAENLTNGSAELRSILASGDAVVLLSPIKSLSDQLGYKAADVKQEEKVESPGKRKQQGESGKRKAETSPKENSPEFQRRTRSSAIASAQGGQTPKNRKGKKTAPTKAPARMMTRMLRSKSTFN